jgi:UPF0042 nucleotide-binding protein
MRLVIISGRSGSGKSSALNQLEDAGFYCIDNLPVEMLRTLPNLLKNEKKAPTNMAISIDARNISESLKKFPEILRELNKSFIQTEVIYIDAAGPTLLKRYSENRRKHPLSDGKRSLIESIAEEKHILAPITDLADMRIDTTSLSLQQLRHTVKEQVIQRENDDIALMFVSFGFKRGVPLDVDFVFDVRCLPNPYWEPSIRQYNGLDQPVIDFLSAESDVADMFDDISKYLERWLPKFEENNRTYMTVGIGCTGGQHRSVYLSEALTRHFRMKFANVQVRHREMA